MQSNDDYILLLNKAFTGVISAGESAQLATWIQQSPENELLASDLRQVWETAGSIQTPFYPDLEADFAKIQGRIKGLDKAPVRVVPMGRRLLRIAAILIFLLAAVWGWQIFNNAPLSTLVEYAGNSDKRLIELPDGSKVWLRRDASLAYPEQFKGRERLVKLNGEAYFEVAHNPEKPFRVELAAGGFVEVLGTQFNVRARAEEDETTVLVRSGKVRFSPDGKIQGATLIKNQKAVFSRQNLKVNVAQVASLNELSWQTGGLEFVSTPLTTVVSDLEQYYNVKIELRDPSMGTCTYTAPLTNQAIEKVLKSISIAYQMRLKAPAPGHYVLEGGNCR